MGKYDRPRENAEVDRAFRQVTNSPTQKNGTPPARKSAAQRKEAERKRRIIIISVCAAVLVLLIGLIIGMIVLAGSPKDDGRILSNVYAGNVNLSGMTLEEAKNALHLATDNTFSKTDMVVKLPDTSIVLSPEDTKAALDVDAVAQAAYDYGRTGSASDLKKAKEAAKKNSYTIPLLPYLDLNLAYIQSTITDFCNSYSSQMTEPTVTITGDRPAYDAEHPDLKVQHQVLTIVMGTPEYILDDGDIYDHVLDAYSMNELTVVYKAPNLTEPGKPDAEAIFQTHCMKPENATIDPTTLEVIPEVYGYGFDVKDLQSQIDQAEYGQTIELTLEFLMPAIKVEDLGEDMFRDVLGQYTAESNLKSAERDKNIANAIAKLQDFVIKEGEEFSFNDTLGKLSIRNGYSKAPVSQYNGSIMGGGISQVASALYYCALNANLDIIERHNHKYQIDFCELGLDAYVDGSSYDLRFRNSTGSPIRILASVEGGQVTVALTGVNSLNYDIKLTAKTVSEKAPQILYQYVDKDNVLGQKDGDILQEGITGYDVDVYMDKYDRETGELLSSLQVSTSAYVKQDQIQVRVESEQPSTEPTEDPTDPTDEPTPTDPTDEPSDPADGPTDPSVEPEPTVSPENITA